jgi:hypothetical protein
MSRADAWFEGLPEKWRERAQQVRELVMDTSPLMREEWKYGTTPFYSAHKWVCYLTLQQERLVLGFTHGASLLDPEQLLERTAHKQIRHYLPPPAGQRMDTAALQRLVAEALDLDASMARAAKGRAKGSRVRASS